MSEDVKTEQPKQPDTKPHTQQQKPQQEEVKIEQEKTVSLSKYEELKKQSNVYLNTARQLQADFDNYRRLTKDTKQEGISEGIKKACETILPAIDTFKKAYKVVEDKKSIEGMKMIEKALLDELSKLKIKRIPTIGHEFDASCHCAVALIEDEKAKSGTIIEELQAGYTLEGKVIRYSQVVVAK